MKKVPRVPMSYLKPSCSRSVRSTKMILAWIDTSLGRRSSRFTKPWAASMLLLVSVRMMELVAVSGVATPRLVSTPFIEFTISPTRA